MLVKQFNVLQAVPTIIAEDTLDISVKWKELATGQDFDVKDTKKSFSSWWISPKAARFSPSRINYAIGELSGGGFIILYIAHGSIAL